MIGLFARCLWLGVLGWCVDYGCLLLFVVAGLLVLGRLFCCVDCWLGLVGLARGFQFWLSDIGFLVLLFGGMCGR